MSQVNDLHIGIEKRYGNKVKAVSYNILYDDTEEIDPLIDLMVQNDISMPAIFIDGELEFAGYIDESAVHEILKSRGLIPTGSR